MLERIERLARLSDLLFQLRLVEQLALDVFQLLGLGLVLLPE